MKDEILIADTVRQDCDMLDRILEDSYNTITATDDESILKIIREKGKKLAVIIICFELMIVDGKSLIDILRKLELKKKVPVLVISKGNDAEALKKCFRKGVTDYLLMPFNETIVRHRVRTVIELFKHKRKAEARIAKQKKEIQLKNKRLSETDSNIIELLGNVVESRNLESGKHIRRVKGFTKIIAEDIMKNCPKYKLTTKKVKQIVSASAIHDIGKINIPDKILLKPGRLTKEEYNQMKAHTVKGSELIEGAREIWGNEYADICRDIILYHHERYDGKGYPMGLKGDEIPIAAQVVSLADVYDALVTKRIYKRSVPPDEAFDMIVSGKCGSFSDDLISSFKRVKKKMESLLW